MSRLDSVIDLCAAAMTLIDCVARAADLSGDVVDRDQVQHGLIGGQGQGVRCPCGI